MLLFVGFTGKAFTSETEVVLQRGETTPIGAYELTYETMAFKEDANMNSTAAALTLRRDGQRLGTLLPERRYYKAFDQGTTEVSIYSDLREDFYLILVGSAEDGSAKFQIYINPLVNFVWLGSIVLILGSLWAMWPTARDRRIARIDRSTAPSTIGSLAVGS
jgi:cytochrome c-type biogenesis protein CcmF